MNASAKCKNNDYLFNAFLRLDAIIQNAMVFLKLTSFKNATTRTHIQTHTKARAHVRSDSTWNQLVKNASWPLCGISFHAFEDLHFFLCSSCIVVASCKTQLEV